MLSEQGIQLKTKAYGFFKQGEREYAQRLASEQGVNGLLEWQSFSEEQELIDEYQKSFVAIIPYTGYAGYFPAACAMGNAVPIIATNVLGHSEYVSDVGLMISPGSPEEIVSAVTRLVEDDALKKELGAKGRKRAEERLTWEAVAAQTLEVFNKALAGG